MRSVIFLEVMNVAFFEPPGELRSTRQAISRTYRPCVELFRFVVPRAGVADCGINAAREATSDELYILGGGVSRGLGRSSGFLVERIAARRWDLPGKAVTGSRRNESLSATLWFVHRLAVELTIPQQVVSPLSLPSFHQLEIILNLPSPQIHRTPESCLKKSNRSGTRIPARESWQGTKNRKEFKICFDSVLDQS